MATTLNLFLSIFFTFIFVLESGVVRVPSRPNALVQPIFKDNETNLHVANIHKRTPQVSLPLIVDLNGRFLWVACHKNYSSSTYNAPFCHSTQCSQAGMHHCHRCSNVARPGCHNNTCAIVSTNPLTKKSVIGELAQDVVSIKTLNTFHTPRNANRWETIPRFLFSCVPSSLLQGSPLPKGVQGVIGLSHSPIALPIQIASHFGFQRQFAVCLSTTDEKNGWISFGDKIPSIGYPIKLSYTPLSIGTQGEYFVPVRSIVINYKKVPLNSSLLSRTRASGGTMISTTTPWTILEHSIYKTIIQLYAVEMTGVPQVEAISPFGLCFNSRYLPPTRVGTPNIDLIFQNRNVSWRIFGVDAVLRVQPGIACLTFVDGGLNPRASITIGAYHLEDVLLHFDLPRSRLGFNPSRLVQATRCSKFNLSSDHLTSDLNGFP